MAQERTLSRFAEPGCVGELGEEAPPAGRVATGFGLGEVAVADVYAGAVCFRREPNLDRAGRRAASALSRRDPS